MESAASWLSSCCCACRRRRRGEEAGSSGGGAASFFFDIKALEAATDNFSDVNRLGEGGFGPVFKGRIAAAAEEEEVVVAVKRLAIGSSQGVRAFTNEVRLLLKVQHRNVVSLIGCCAHPKHKMLVYPFFPNRSLDGFLFRGESERALLDWPKRFEIIAGVAKGLLYLHEESPVKIIHRDIKASNILLDDQLRPKISDFGMARLFSSDDTHVNTFKIAGTYGYMAPEYAMSGYLSAKSDVFSFGVLVLEILSGRRNLDRHLEEKMIDLLDYTWLLFEQGNSMEIVDPLLAATCDAEQAALCIRVGLLCCQAIVAHRPSMSDVHIMLSSGSSALPMPGKPGVRGRVGRWTSTTTLSPPDTRTESSACTDTSSDAK